MHNNPLGRNSSSHNHVLELQLFETEEFFISRIVQLLFPECCSPGATEAAENKTVKKEGSLPPTDTHSCRRIHTYTHAHTHMYRHKRTLVYTRRYAHRTNSTAPLLLHRRAAVHLPRDRLCEATRWLSLGASHTDRTPMSCTSAHHGHRPDDFRREQNVCSCLSLSPVMLS